MNGKWKRIILTTSILILSTLALMSYGKVWDFPLHLVGLERDIMPRGAEDFSNVRSGSPLHRLDDMAELAARLGSPVIFDRQGSIIYIESFEHGLRSWHKGLYGTGADISCSPDQARTGAFSCKLTGGSDGNKSAKINRYFPYPHLSKMGLEFSMLFEAHTTAIHFLLADCDGTNENQYRIRYDPDDGNLKYYDPDGVWQEFAIGVWLQHAYSPFHTFKLVCDFENGEFDRLIVNNQVIDMSGYLPNTFANPINPSLRIDIIVYSDDGYNGFSYVDDIIVTQNEP